MFIRRKSFFSSLVLLSSTRLFASGAKPDVLIDLDGLKITNSMLTTWIIGILVVLLLRFIFLRHGASRIPSRGQLALEILMDKLGDFFQPIMGRRAFKAAFPFLISLFLFILTMNWSGLIPGMTSIGSNKVEVVARVDLPKYLENGFHIDSNVETENKDLVRVEKFIPYFRPATSDYNTTLMLGMLSFFLWIYFVMRFAGPIVLFKDWFGNKAKKSETPIILYYFLFPIFFAVGFIEVISALIRPISLSFRLYGNVYGGEKLLDNMYGIFAYFMPIPFCFFELMTGLIQAFVFTLLSAIYIGLITIHTEHQGGEEVHH